MTYGSKMVVRKVCAFFFLEHPVVPYTSLYTPCPEKRVYSILGLTSSNTDKFPVDCNSERISKIGQYLMKLCLKYSRLFFPDTV